MMILGNSPWAAWRANRKSACSVLVGSPVAGPALCHRIMTGPGPSVIPAQHRPSDISEHPGPEVEVDERSPAWAAPVAMLMADISSSACTTILLYHGRSASRFSL